QSRPAVIQYLAKNFGFSIGDLLTSCKTENANLLIKENVNKEQTLSKPLIHNFLDFMILCKKLISSKRLLFYHQYSLYMV
ncbi:MAG: hypothetical protein Q8787_02775, partial [Sweet potato little leaf phytoplasma]|nr:hypothetical protein [Sweet potato little leaf phytoplasma]